jgi:hypothetical protein
MSEAFFSCARRAASKALCAFSTAFCRRSRSLLPARLVGSSACSLKGPLEPTGRIARKSIWDVDADLKAGALVELLRGYSAGSTGLQIVYPAAQDQPKRVRLLIEKIAAAFSSSAATV